MLFGDNAVNFKFVASKNSLEQRVLNHGSSTLSGPTPVFSFSFENSQKTLAFLLETDLAQLRMALDSACTENDLELLFLLHTLPKYRDYRLVHCCQFVQCSRWQPGLPAC